MLRLEVAVVEKVMNEESLLRLHIGGKEPHPDWKIVDVEPRPEVDFVCNAANLEQFADDSVEAIYASHVLEHFYYNIDNELLNTLKEWQRVLKPGGQLLISVPDLRTLCWLYLNPSATLMDRLKIMRMMFGGQVNEYDVHKVGLDFDTLGMYVEAAGFQDYEQVLEFELFRDCSTIRVLNTLISLNVVATK